MMSILNYILASGSSTAVGGSAAGRRYWPTIAPRATPIRRPKNPNPAGTKLARKARERKLGLRWC
jgi:hypothetical protein